MAFNTESIFELPLCASPQPNYLLAIGNFSTNQLESIPLETFLTSETSQDFEWVTDNNPGYALNEVVTYGGKWWQSLISNNLNIVPGTDPAKWQEINKSPSGLAMWQAGVFPQDLVLVVNEIGDDALQLYRLDPDEPRPFVSSNFSAELSAGKWLPMYVPHKNDHFRGLYPSLVALQTAVPVGNPGDFAGVDAGLGQPIEQYLWDAEEGWVPTNSDPIVTDGSYTVKGVFELATQTEVNNGTGVGSTTAPLVIGPPEFLQSKFLRRIYTQNISGVVTIDLSIAELFILTLTGNVTAFNYSNEIVGKDYVIIFKQDTTYKTLVWSTTRFEFPFNNAPILTDPTTNGTSGPPRSKDIITLLCIEAGLLNVVFTPNMIRN
jgi:hypothetical protein